MAEKSSWGRPLPGKVFDFLEALAYDNAEPSEPWISEGDFDPRFPRAVLAKAEGYGLIEVDRASRAADDRPEDGWLFRFTSTGRARLRAARVAAAIRAEAA